MRPCLNRLLVFLTSSLAGISVVARPCTAVDLGTGLSAIEDGDERLRPAAVVHVGTAGGFVSRFYLYGRDYGPVQERNYLLSADKRFDIGGKTFQGLVGLAVLCDTTSIRYKDHPEENSSFSSTNFGMAFGLHWNFVTTKSFQMTATWDSHVFPAGTGFVYLANGRKSGLGLTGSTFF